MSNVESQSLGIDPRRTRRLQDCASNIKTKFTDPEEFVDAAIAYFIDMWQSPESTWDNFIGYTKHMHQDIRTELKAQFSGELKEAIELQEKNIDSLEELGDFNREPDTDFRFPVEPALYNDIQKIFDDNPRLQNYLHGGHTKAFVNEAIHIFVLLWKIDPENVKEDLRKLMNRSYEIYELLPKNIINSWKENYPITYEQFQEGYEYWKKDTKNKVRNNLDNSNNQHDINEDFKNIKNKKDFSKILDENISKEPDLTLPKKEYALISQYNNRFLPVKLVTVFLAEMIYNNKGGLVDYKKFSETCFERVLKIAEKLRKEEKTKIIKRNEKFSTGLPLARDGEASKKRFLEHYIGTSANTWKNRQNKLNKSSKELAKFDGALNSFGFAYFVPKIKNEIIKKGRIPDIDKIDDLSIEVGITKRGLQFALMDNDILDNFDSLEFSRTNWKKPLTNDESKFIRNTVIPDFIFEERISKNLIKEIEKPLKIKECEDCGTKNRVCSHYIDKRFEKLVYENQKNVGKLVDEGASSIPELSDITSLLKGGILEKQFNQDQKLVLEQWRSALMGRLTELGMIDWKISGKDTKDMKKPGISYYTISKH